jgi:excisionase family DNA binding protein
MHVRDLVPGLTRWRHPMPDSTHKTKIDPAVLTVHEVAQYLRISEAKVYRLAREGSLPVIRIGRTWRFRKDLLDDWLGQRAEASLKANG